VWLTGDPLRGQPARPRTLHRYAYAFASPITYYDAYGLQGEGLPEGAVPSNCFSSGSGPLPPPEYVCGLIPNLPGCRSLFQRLPVNSVLIYGLQWYGNTVFAYEHGREHNYPGYSQGLHGGIDFIAKSGTPVTAGVYGEVVAIDPGYFGPHRVDVRVGNYRLIYGHVGNLPANIQVGSKVIPTTVLGEIESTEGHLHLEMRGLYDASGGEDYIYNPLWFMDRQMVETLAGVDENPQESFYKPAGKWLGILDQPIIIRGGPVLVPRDEYSEEK
jgi:murein DD-endopeptidase MepM/ murein hydrolase activator NlpD